MTADRPSSEHVAIFCLMRPTADEAETLLDTLLALVQPTRAEAGCIAYDVYEEADAVPGMGDQPKSLQRTSSSQPPRTSSATD
jgi:quinol monooxygenase YgiN